MGDRKSSSVPISWKRLAAVRTASGSFATPGHISVLDPVGSLLVVGDAMGNVNHRLSGSNPQYTADMAQANQSIKKLAALTFAKAVFGHGDPIDQDASAAVATLARTL